MNKWQIITLTILLLNIAGNIYQFIRYRNLQETEHVKVEHWKKQYSVLKQTYDSLQISLTEIENKQQQVKKEYENLLETNRLKYEKVIAGFDTLSVDEHIVILSGYLSEKDNF